jgi:glycerol-3-phosphate acyltransferase PlsX
MLIALDAMGGDRAPGEVVKGAVSAAQQFDIEVALVGPPDRIGAELKQLPAARGISIIPAAEQISMDEHPLDAVRRKRQSSIVVGTELVKDGRADAFVSAGNTGAVLAAATLILGRLEGVERPALGAVMPGKDGKRTLMLDAGANADCRPSQLVQFALMGQAYARAVFAVAQPQVGLISIGEEDSKGNQLVLETNERLRKQDGVCFFGNIEGKDLPLGVVDVAVTDGFTGNVILKSAEGTADYVLQELRNALNVRTRYRLAALLLRPAFARLRQRLDYAEYGGAPLLGVHGTVLVSHGRSDAHAIASAVRTARDAAASDLISALSASLRE